MYLVLMDVPSISHVKTAKGVAITHPAVQILIIEPESAIYNTAT